MSEALKALDVAAGLAGDLILKVAFLAAAVALSLALAVAAMVCYFNPMLNAEYGIGIVPNLGGLARCVGSLIAGLIRSRSPSG